MDIFYDKDELTDPQLKRVAKLLHAGNRFQASSILATFLRAYPDNEQAWHMLMYALEDQKQQVTVVQRALEMDPDDGEALSWLGRLSSPFEEATPLQVQLDMREQARPEPAQLEHIKTDSLIAQEMKRRKFLISGHLSSLALALAREFIKERDKVVFASDDAEIYSEKLDKVKAHCINPSDNLFHDALSSYNFDVVIYIAAREEQVLSDPQFNSGQMLDGLKNVLQLSKNSGVKRFVYVSSTEVYGELDNTSEIVEPRSASINGHTILAGEQYCNYFNRNYGLNTTIIRLPNIYGPDEKGTLLCEIIRASKNEDKVVFPASADTLCSFLHADDVADLIKRVLNEAYTSYSRVLNLSCPDQLRYSELAQMLKTYFPGTEYEYEESGVIFTRPVAVSTARNVFDWTAKRKFRTELPKILDAILDEPVSKESAFEKLKSLVPKYQGAVKWVELILGAVLMQFLVEVTGTLLQFKVVDFRLLYVVLMGAMHGSQFGLIASLIAGLSGLFSWHRLGFDWALLIYNIENWLPFAMYFIAGAITGYIHDKNENEMGFKDEEVNLLHEKYSFLYGVYKEIEKLKDHFRQQLMGYRDSFGRIFNVTRELDTLQEDDVFFRALSILEDIMSNENLAIYTIEKNADYARLEVSSRQLINKIDKSLNLSDFPEIVQNFETSEIYQNTAMLPNYPAYFAPIMHEDAPVAAVVIWDAKFEQYSMYYYNLFKVLCGLVQTSLVRATLYLESNIDRMYIHATNILESEAFLEVLEIKRRMKRSKVSDYQLLKVERGSKDIIGFSNDITKGIRSVDFIGSTDGKYYILLSQVDKVSIDVVVNRLRGYGIEGELVEL
ncbi:MAG: NAD-dependent epimerase/dehydratase family protein [Chloroflexota bacterium]|nr:NAD-dependent epimerase/dehydratase family protein [Chloroflexota bacterium]